MRDGGIYSLASDKLFSSDDYQLWLFWLGIIFITLGFMVWCALVLFDYMRLAFFERTVEQNVIKFNANLLGKENLSIAERNFLQDLNKKDRNVQIAFAIVIKDYVVERKRAIKGLHFSSDTPTYSHIVEHTESALSYLFSDVHTLHRYESDKYYNADLLVAVGANILKDS